MLHKGNPRHPPCQVILDSVKLTANTNLGKTASPWDTCDINVLMNVETRKYQKIGMYPSVTTLSIMDNFLTISCKEKNIFIMRRQLFSSTFSFSLFLLQEESCYVSQGSLGFNPPSQPTQCWDYKSLSPGSWAYIIIHYL